MRSAVASQKIVRAAQLGYWAATRGCSDVDFIGWRAITLAGAGRWDILRELLKDGRTDPEGRIDIARAALALHDGEPGAVARLEEGWSGDQPLRPQAEALVANATRHAPVVSP
jgi:hypothetical protein